MDESDRSEEWVEIRYTNYRGAKASRYILPQRLWFGSTEWHPEPQWLLDAEGREKGPRTFAVKDISGWQPNPFGTDDGPISPRC